MRNRYDIRFYQESADSLRIWVNDKLREHETLRGVVPTTVTADLANSFKNDLTDAMRHYAISYDEIPAFLEHWLKFLAETDSKEFTDGSNSWYNEYVKWKKRKYFISQEVQRYYGN